MSISLDEAIKSLATKRQREVKAAIDGLWKLNKRPPTIVEIAAKCGVSSSTANEHIQRMIALGMIERPRPGVYVTDASKKYLTTTRLLELEYPWKRAARSICAFLLRLPVSQKVIRVDALRSITPQISQATFQDVRRVLSNHGALERRPACFYKINRKKIRSLLNGCFEGGC